VSVSCQTFAATAQPLSSGRETKSTQRHMEKKSPVFPFPNKAMTKSAEETWHNGADVEITLYARSLHNAAKTLTATLDLEPNPKTAWDACPIILLYRQAVELRLKMVVGQGSNFLKSPTDHITLYKTHSLRWLARIVYQIIKTVKWESEFKCEGVTSFADFSDLVSELEASDPVLCAVRFGGPQS
jgi:hypothetical protein